MEDFYKKATLVYRSALWEIMYLSSIKETLDYVFSLFKEKNIEITEEIENEIHEWVDYIHGGIIPKYLYRLRNGGEPKNPLLRLEKEKTLENK